MGNAGSNPPRERMKTGSGEIAPPSPNKEGQAFVFDKKPRLSYQGSNEEEETDFAKPDVEFVGAPRPRSNTLSEGTKNEDHSKVCDLNYPIYNLIISCNNKRIKI